MPPSIAQLSYLCKGDNYLKENTDSADSLKLKLPYASDSEILFAGKKQKIFALSSSHGLDLIRHIREQIRIQSSEYRLLPAVPRKGEEMVSKALLTTPDATLQADALRKADVVSVRRLGLSLLIRDIEIYAADLRPNSWKELREEFYGLVRRYLLTPTGFFDFFGNLPRVFGLMLACGDIKEASSFVLDLIKVTSLIEATTTAGEDGQSVKFKLCLAQCARALHQHALQAATEREINLDASYVRVIRKLKRFDPDIKLPSRPASLEKVAHQILLADWGRRPYKDYWYLDQQEDEVGPPIPRQFEVRRKLRLGWIRRFRTKLTDLKTPHWPALAFPTRPLSIDEIALVAPPVLDDISLFKRAIMVLRGAQVRSNSLLGINPKGEDIEKEELVHFNVPGKQKPLVRVAVTSFMTTDDQWVMAAKRKYDRSLYRYDNLNRLINQIIQEARIPDYIVFPELSIPLRWGLRIARMTCSP